MKKMKKVLGFIFGALLVVVIGIFASCFVAFFRWKAETSDSENKKDVKVTKETIFELFLEEHIVSDTDKYLEYHCVPGLFGVVDVDKDYIFEREDGSWYYFYFSKGLCDEEKEIYGHLFEPNETYYYIELQDCIYDETAESVDEKITERIGDTFCYLAYWEDEELRLEFVGIEENTVKQEDVSYSEKILFSINNGAAGYGTISECTDATIMVYKDKTVHVFMNTEEAPEVFVATLSDEEFEQLEKIANPKKITKIKAREDQEVLDGSSFYIKLYDETDQVVFSVGGYMPDGDEFWETYEAIKEILEPYEIEDAVDDYREQMEEEN